MLAHASVILVQNIVNGCVNEGASMAANLTLPIFQDQYVSKISVINRVDPLLGVIAEAEATSELPPVEASDLVSYLVLQTSFITSHFKARKSLDAYNQFVCGWGRMLPLGRLQGKFLIVVI